MTGDKLLGFRNQLQTANEGLFPAVITIGADPTEYTASTGGLKHGESFIRGGTLPDDDIIFRVRKTLLANPPEIGTLVTWIDRNLTFRFVDVYDNSANDPCWRLHCTQVEPK